VEREAGLVRIGGTTYGSNRASAEIPGLTSGFVAGGPGDGVRETESTGQIDERGVIYQRSLNDSAVSKTLWLNLGVGYELWTFKQQPTERCSGVRSVFQTRLGRSSGWVRRWYGCRWSGS